MENGIIKSRLLEELEELLSIVPPQQLRKSIHQIFARYLQTINNETDLEEFKILAEDFYFLNRFLERVEGLDLENLLPQDGLPG